MLLFDSVKCLDAEATLAGPPGPCVLLLDSVTCLDAEATLAGPSGPCLAP